MNESFINKHLKGIIAILAILVLVWLGFAIYRQFTFRITDTDPSVDNVATVTPFFNIGFSKPLNGSNITVNSSPNIISSYKISGQNIDINLNEPLTANQKYTISLENISDTAGKRLKAQVFVFVPHYIPSNQLPKDQQQALLKNQVKYQEANSNPILAHLPHDTLDYNLTAGSNTTGQSGFTLQALIFINQAQLGNEQAAISQIKQEIASYIQSLGLIPDNYTIEYTVSS